MNTDLKLSKRVIILLSLISAYTTYSGFKIGTSLQSDFVSQQVIPISIGAAAFSLIALFWFWVMDHFLRHEQVDQKKLFWVVLLPMFIIIAFASTTLSVIGLGGKLAMEYHMVNSVADIRNTADMLSQRIAEEQKLERELSNWQHYADDAATREERGELSGFEGKGAVVRSLRGIAGTLENIAGTIKGNNTERRALMDKLSSEVVLLSTDVVYSTEIRNIETKMAIFGERTSKINQMLQDVLANDPVELVKTTALNLTKLAQLETPSTGSKELREAQTFAIKRLGSTVETIGAGIKQTCDKMATHDKIELQNIAVINVWEAITRYWIQIIYIWIFALALDFAPGIIGVMEKNKIVTRTT